MPEQIKKQFEASARKKGLTGRRAARYVYGGLNNRGFMRGNQETAKGVAAEEKYESDHGIAGVIKSVARKRRGLSS